jgi:membrane fusion protein (multidrug efflux system)
MPLDDSPPTQAQAQSPSAPLQPAPSRPDPAKRRRRVRLFIILGIVIAVLAIAYLIYWLLVSSHHVETDNAYVQASTAQVSALVDGQLISVPIYETQVVKKGQVLAVIDPADFRLAVDRARADLDQSERKVRQYFANDQALGAAIQARNAEIVQAQAQLRRAEVDYGRRRNLAGAGAVSGDELTAAETARNSAQAALAQARANAVAAGAQQRAANVLVAGSDVANNPEVLGARTRLAQAELNLARTVIRAPVDGVVTKNTLEVGQKVTSGAPLMSIVPVQSAYVDANFKEVQLRKVRPGQAVILTSDLYGKGVKFHGKVVGFSGGTGSAFAVIPSQNATGNWIKVVQRLPVRISLDPKELAQHPVRVGLSMKADIDIGG